MATAMTTVKDFQAMVYSEPVKKRFSEVLGKGVAAFMSTLLTVYSSNSKLQECSPKSILGAAGMAATVGLPINPSFGYAYIVPYKGQAQFQVGTKGLVQLAHRTGQYIDLNAKAIYEGEIQSFDFLTDKPILGEKVSEEIVGYLAYFKLVNGFEKVLYMTKAEIENHAKKFSQSYAYDLRSGKKSSVWTTNFDAMAKKTVLKMLLNKWGVMSIEMQQTIAADQSIVDKTSFTYVDNSGERVRREELNITPEDTEIVEEKAAEEISDDEDSPFEEVDMETGEILPQE